MGIDLIPHLLGQKIIKLRRYVLGLGESNDKFGHGITEIEFERSVLVVKPGENEDDIVIEEGRITPPNAQYWTMVTLSDDEDWSGYQGSILMSVDCYTDGIADVALIFGFQNAKQFSFILCDTDLIIARGLEPFEKALEKVDLQLRQHISYSPSV